MLNVDDMIEAEHQQLYEKQKTEDAVIEAALIAALERAETVSSDVARMLGEK